VKKPFIHQLTHNLIKILKDLTKIDYIVVNHVEMDHSGSLPEIIERVKPEKIFCSVRASKILKEHFNFKDWPIVEVKTGDEVSIGKRKIKFIETPMIHWPESMMCYIPEEKILISQDAFGQHYATSKRFDDEVNYDELMQEALKYYANIVLPFSMQVEKLLNNVQELEINMILPDHGVIWRSYVKDILDAYKRWSTYKTKEYALIVYATMWQSTEKMAFAIAEGLMAENILVKVMNANLEHRSDIATQLLEAKAVILGSSTLNNNMLPQMADILTYLKGLKPRQKLGMAFGSFGWSGESVMQINEFLKEIKAKIVHPGLKIKFVPTHDDLKECQKIGKLIANTIKEDKS